MDYGGIHYLECLGDRFGTSNNIDVDKGIPGFS